MSNYGLIYFLFSVPAGGIKGRATPTVVQEGAHVTLGCDSSTSNPPSNITWFSGGSKLDGSSQYFTDGSYGGKSTRLVK